MGNFFILIKFDSCCEKPRRVDFLQEESNQQINQIERLFQRAREALRVLELEALENFQDFHKKLFQPVI